MPASTFGQPFSSNSRNSPSPSPPPPPPVAVTPGPRATALLRVFDNALSHTLRKNSYSNFAACFPTPARNMPDVLETVWRQMNHVLEERAKVEWEEVLAQREVVARLNELDRLVGEAQNRKAQGGGEPTRPMHLLKPDELFLAHLGPSLQQAQKSLSEKLEATQTENKDLATSIKHQKKEIEKLLGNLKSIIRDLEGAAEALGETTEKENLKSNIVEMETELKIDD
ncbi:MAG: hypothetical protein M1834_000669 [Cirrosporium novae-zelandiae]|nr:MAG: hypothetical protein M1834_000669 [Cirrosporium novae-zelandiae]